MCCVRLVSRRYLIDICMCTYGMYITLEIFGPTLKCYISALRPLSPEYPQSTAFTKHIQACYILYEHFSAGSQIDAIVEHLITVRGS